MHLWVEPAGGEWKSSDVEWKTVMLIYPYPSVVNFIKLFWCNLCPHQYGDSSVNYAKKVLWHWPLVIFFFLIGQLSFSGMVRHIE
jgi:hypothetical protein